MRGGIKLIVAVVVLVVLFVALNMLAGGTLRGLRLDATQGSLFTLTSGARKIARAPDEPITLRFYYSAGVAQGRPEVQSYAQRVREMLEEFRRASGGKINLEIIDPEPFSEEEDAAVGAGLTGVPVNSAGESLYMGLSGTNTIDTRETIPFFDPRKERFLEYDIARMIYTLSHPTKRTIGLISGLPMEGGFSMDPRTRQPVQTPPWQMMNEIKGAFDVRALTGDEPISADISALVVAHPTSLSDAAVFAIDQWVLSGGATIIFADPLCEADLSAGQGSPGVPSAQGLSKLWGAWGVEIPAGMVAADELLGEPVLMRSGSRPEQVTYLVWLGCDKRALSRDDASTGNLSKVNFGTAGIIRAKEGAAKPALVTPVVTTTPRSMAMPAEVIGFPPDPKAVTRAFAAGDKALTLAARLGGRVASAFPDGPPEGAKVGEGGSLKESAKDMNVLLIADCDVLGDGLWARPQNFFGQQVLTKIADNSDFVVGAIDNISGGTDLVSVRAREESTRPFTTVQDMERRAQARYLAEEEALEALKKDTEERLAQLQQPGADGGSLVLTPEQEAEVQKFRAQLLDTRKKLREVKKGLRDDIDRLGVQLKLINTALVPALVTVFAIGLGLYRRARRAESVAMAAKGVVS
ncbi:MAG: GldG family protein [Phycisphaerales bacterium]|nr:GldG family protein [Phycisphaerales bacterium]